MPRSRWAKVQKARRRTRQTRTTGSRARSREGRQVRASSLLLSGYPTSISRRPTCVSRACRSSATGTWTCLNPRAWRTMARRTAEAASTKRTAVVGGKHVARGERRAAAIAATTTRCRRTRTRAKRMGTRGMETRDSRSTASRRRIRETHLPVCGIRPRALEIHPRVRAAMGRRALAMGPRTRAVLRAVVGTVSLRLAGAGRRIGHGIRADMRGIEAGTRGGCSRDQAWG